MNRTTLAKPKAGRSETSETLRQWTAESARRGQNAVRSKAESARYAYDEALHTGSAVSSGRPGRRRDHYRSQRKCASHGPARGAAKSAAAKTQQSVARLAGREHQAERSNGGRARRMRPNP
jgi:hypothetical protein